MIEKKEVSLEVLLFVLLVVFLTDRPETATYKNKWGANVNLSHEFTAQSIMILIHRSSALLIAHDFNSSLICSFNCS